MSSLDLALSEMFAVLQCTCHRVMAGFKKGAFSVATKVSIMKACLHRLPFGMGDDIDRVWFSRPASACMNADHFALTSPCRRVSM
jgi:hypothetical protein